MSDMTELARRAVACKGWRWLPGMRAIGGCVVATGCPLWLVDGVPRMPEDGKYYMWLRRTTEHPDVLPDLDDPATLGCLLHLVRESWGDDTLTLVATRAADRSRGWMLEAWDPISPADAIGPFPTEAEVLVEALKAAP